MAGVANGVWRVSGRAILAHRLRADREYTVKRYDFRRPDKFSREQIQTIHLIHETFGRLAGPSLSALLQRSVTVSASLVDQCTYEEYTQEVTGGTAQVVVSMQPLKGTMVLELDEQVASVLIDGLFGDPGTGAAPAGIDSAGAVPAPIGELDRVAIGYAAEKLLGDLAEAWRPISPIAPDVRQIESDPQYTQIVPPKEMIILVGLDVTMARATGRIRLAIPYLTIEPVIGRLSYEYWYSKRLGGAPGAGGVDTAGLDVPTEVVYETESILLSDLPTIAGGQPLRLPRAGDGARLVMGGVPVATVVEEAGDGAARARYRIAAAQRSAPAAGAAHAGPWSDQALEAIASRIDTLTDEVRELAQSQRFLSADLAVEAPPSQTLEAATEAHARALALLLERERPQAVAFVLGMLPAGVAAAVLSLLPEAMQPVAVERLARIGATDEILRRTVSRHLGRAIAERLATRETGGPEHAARILNGVPRSVEKHVMESFQRDDGELFESIARLLFVFEDFVLVDAAAIGTLMTRVDPQEMALAMKSCGPEVTDHILGALDADTARAIRDAAGRLDRVRRRDVEAAQRDIIEELRQLEHAGEVVVARPEDLV